MKKVLFGALALAGALSIMSLRAEVILPPLGGGGATISGTITGAYSFSGGFTTVNATNVSMLAGISNLALYPPITNVISRSTTNALSRPLTSIWDRAAGTLSLWGLEQGSNIVMFGNGSNIVINGVISETNAVLANLIGTTGRNVTNVVSLSTTNATSKPLTNSYASGVLTLFGLEQGANVTLTPNGSNIVIASSGGGSVDPTNQVLIDIISTGAITNIDEANIYYVRTNGNDSTAVKGRLDKPWREISNAVISATLSGSLIDVGVGRWTNLTVFNFAHGVSMRGKGKGITQITNFIDLGTVGAGILLANNTVLQGMSISGGFDEVTVNLNAPIGIGNTPSQATEGFTNAILNDIEVSGPSDCLYFNTTNVITLDVFNSQFFGADGDMLVFSPSNSSRIRLIDCDWKQVSSVAGVGTVNPININRGQAVFIRNSLSVSNAASHEALRLGTALAYVELYDVSLNLGLSSDIQINNAGTVYIHKPSDIDPYRLSGAGTFIYGQKNSLTPAGGTNLIGGTLSLTNLGTNAILLTGAGSQVVTGKLSGATISSDGTLTITAAGAITTNENQFGAATALTIATGARLTNIWYSSYLTNLALIGTNQVADGTLGNIFTNFFAIGPTETNLIVTNINDGQMITMWVHPGNGVVVKLPQFTGTNYTDGGIISIATNQMSKIEVTRRGIHTNVVVSTRTFEINWNNISASTNFATGTITLTGPSGTPAGSTFQIQYNTNGAFGAQPSFYYNVITNELVISNNFAGGSRLSLKSPLLEFAFKAEEGTNRIIATNSGTHALDIEMGPIGPYLIRTNSFQPPKNISTDLGQSTFRWRTHYASTVDTTNITINGGTLGAGKVLTDTAGNGVGTWQTAAAGSGTNFDGIIVTNAISRSATNITGLFGTTTNWVWDWSTTGQAYTPTGLHVNAAIALTNAYGFVAKELFLLGQTNAATNHDIIITAANGATIQWTSPTNGTFAFTLYSNSWAKVFFESHTNANGGTNIWARWETDNGWGQRNLAITASAGAGKSNIWVGGRMYRDFGLYTNLNSTIGTFTNLATNIISGNTLTNIGDELVIESKGFLKLSVTNLCRFTSVYGSETVFDSANVGASNTVFKIVTKITALGNTSQLVDTHFECGPVSGAPSAYTNFLYNAVQTNGVDTGFGHRGSSAAAMGLTNVYFSIFYSPGPR